MKGLSAVLAAAVALVCAATAAAAVNARGLQLDKASTTIRYGSHVVLNGVAPAGSPVTLAARSTGKVAQGLLSAQSSETGAFRFEVAPLRRTVFVAQSDAGAATVVVNVMPRIGLLRNGTVRVAPVAPFAGKTVVLQRFVDGAWTSVGTSRFDGAGVAHVSRWSTDLTLRAYVPSIGHGFVAGVSRTLTADGGLVLR